MLPQPLLVAAMLALAADPQPGTTAFEFKDSATYDGRAVLQYRAVEFRNAPLRPLERKFPADALYGLVRVGPKPETALTIVWMPGAAGGAEIWLDSNADGKLTDDERHAMTGRELEVAADITLELKPEPKKVRRTLMFRRSALGEGLRYTVRGYMQGRLELGGAKYAALLVDGNANGCFDTVGQDRVWIDLNQDGRFDPLEEQFPLGKPITHKGEVYVVRADAAASAVTASLRTAGQGKLRLALAKKLPSAKVSAELISDLGELVIVDKLDEAVPVPYGEYRVSMLKLQTPAADGQMWTYDFYSDTPRTHAVPTGGETTVRMLGQLEMNVQLPSGKEAASPGETILIQPKLMADESLYLSSCTIGSGDDSRRAEANAEILLLAPGGEVASRGLTGFS